MLKRYFHTIKYLRLEQIYFRLYYLLRKPIIRSLQIPTVRLWLKPWVAPKYITPKISSEGLFCSLQRSGNIHDPAVWCDTQHSQLWLYHLHYFDACNAKDAVSNEPILTVYIEEWIQHNPPITTPAWDPYPISLRVVNWITWFATRSVPPKQHWIESLVLQADILMQRIEYHILANHLFVNGKALIFLGSYFSGAQASCWLHKGLSILDREIKEQFLSDGGHFELSPMYHALLLWDLCDICNLARHVSSAALQLRVPHLRQVITQGLAWLSHMSHPDGDIAFFNDATLESAPTLSDFQAYMIELGWVQPKKIDTTFTVRSLQESGFVVVDLPPEGKAILDVGQLGAVYQPGHAHADTLSFELSLYGQRFLVNSGISEYGISSLRTWQRSTQAHNTVCINDTSSSEIWSGFRVAQRAEPVAFSMDTDRDCYRISCGHNGYMKGPRPVMHHRIWTITRNKMEILDRIDGCYHSCKAYFYFHPDVRIMEKGAQEFECTVAARTVRMVFDGATEIHEKTVYWYPAFGKVVPNRCLVVTFHGHRLETKILWM